MLMPMSKSFAEMVEAGRDDALLPALVEIGREYGLEDFAYVTTVGRNSMTTAPLIETSYPSAWLERYTEMRYDRTDPVVRAATSGILPVEWSAARAAFDGSESFFGEAREFGIQDEGLAVPVRDEKGRKAVFSISVAMTGAEWRSFLHERMPDLHYLAYAFHQQYWTRQEGGIAGPGDPLTRRETQVLLWAARGKTVWETSAILDLSARTVETYLKTCCRKLGAANKTHAVAIGLECGAISHQDTGEG